MDKKYANLTIEEKIELAKKEKENTPAHFAPSTTTTTTTINQEENGN